MSRRMPAPGARTVAAPPFQRPIPVRSLSRKRPLPFDVAVEPDEKARIAGFLGIEALRALRFRGELSPARGEGWRIEGRLTAEVVQSCVATLAPVVQTVDEPVAREFVPEETYAPPEEIDLDPDAEDDPDPFGNTIDPGVLALESLALMLDPYPRAPGTPPADLQVAPPGIAPLADTDLKPFAKLAVLREKLGDRKE